jgi:hypothetical protein
MIYLTAIGLPPGGSSTVHIYTQTIHRTTQKQTIHRRTQKCLEQCGPCPVLASYTLAFAVQPREKHLKNMKESANSKIHISSNFLLSIYLLIQTDTLLLGPSLHCKHFTTLHPTTLHYTYRHFTSSHLHFTTLSFGLTDILSSIPYTRIYYHWTLPNRFLSRSPHHYAPKHSWIN